MTRKLSFAVLFLIAGVISASAQESLSFSVVNEKGKSMGGKVRILLKSADDFQSLPKSGTLTLYPAANDTVFLTAGSYMGSIPLAGLRTLTVVFGKGTMVDQATGTSYPVVKLPPLDPNNIPDYPGIDGFHSLLTLVTTIYPAIRTRLNTNELYLIEKQSPNSPINILIVLDGAPTQSFMAVSESVRPSEVQSIVLKKNDTLYGMRGAGGVLEIRRKTGRSTH